MPPKKPKKKQPKEILKVLIPSGSDVSRKKLYSCMICEAMFRDAGMCPQCKVMLKKKAM